MGGGGGGGGVKKRGGGGGGERHTHTILSKVLLEEQVTPGLFLYPKKKKGQTLFLYF